MTEVLKFRKTQYMTDGEFDSHLRCMRSSPYLIVDTEGTLTHPHSETWGLSYSANGVSEYFAFNHMLGVNLPQIWVAKLKYVLENHPCLVFHNAKHDLRALRNLGIYFTGKFYDSMLMAHWVDENIMSKELDYLSPYFGGSPKMMPQMAKDIIDSFGWDYIPVDLMRSYADNDAVITEELFYKLLPKFQAQGFDGELWDVEQDFIRLMGDVEDQGVLINQGLAEQELARGLGIMKELRSSLGFNPNSPTDLKKFIIDEMGLPVLKKTEKGNPSFDKKTMEKYDQYFQRLNDKRAQMILTYRGWMKTTSSNYKPYLERVSPVDGRLRISYKLHGTVTGRMSASLVQQIPSESPNDWNGNLKPVFIVEKGRRAWEFDYKQLEFRLGAAYGKEMRLIEIFNDRERDIFEEMSKHLGMSRRATKTTNYLMQFGGGPPAFERTFGIPRTAAMGIRNNYFRNYRGLKKISDFAASRAKQQGYVNYWTGRRRHFREDWEHRKAFSSLCQGGAFEIVKRRMIALDKAGLNNDECRIDMQVHDAIRADIEEGKEQIYIPEITKIMEDVPEFNVGLKFHVDCHEWGKK